MRRDDVFHVARAAADVVGVRRVLIVGSQAVLGTHQEEELPEEVLASIEADVIILDDIGGDAHHQVEANIGYMSMFHTTHGYYAEGVEEGTAVLPDGWEGRVLEHKVARAGGDHVSVYFPELHDLCVSKLVAGRTNDRTFVGALCRAGLVDPEILIQRSRELPADTAPEIVARTTDLAESVCRRGS